MRTLSSCSKWGYSSLQCTGFSMQWLLLLQSTGSKACGIQKLQHTRSVVWCTGLVAPWYVGSSQTKDQTCVPYIGRLILNHQTTRVSLSLIFNELPSCVPKQP